MAMRSIVDVLREKEKQMEVLKGEIETLQTAVRILAGEKEHIPLPTPEPVLVAARNWP